MNTGEKTLTIQMIQGQEGSTYEYSWIQIIGKAHEYKEYSGKLCNNTTATVGTQGIQKSKSTGTQEYRWKANCQTLHNKMSRLGTRPQNLIQYIWAAWQNIWIGQEMHMLCGHIKQLSSHNTDWSGLPWTFDRRAGSLWGTQCYLLAQISVIRTWTSVIH